ncbi:MAG: phosphate ABC transporter ATP-binding protein, partial [Planctomycetota bacterium]
RALLLEPEVLLLDEPCSALDPLSAEAIERLLVRLRSRCTIVLVTHQLAQARRIADHLGMFWMEGGVGRLLEAGEREQILARPRHPVTRAYILGLRG